MSARCKPGDLAVVVGPVFTPGLLGRFVIVERKHEQHEPLLPGVPFDPRAPKELTWWCRSAAAGTTLPMKLLNSAILDCMRRPIADALLRPIRPDEGEDETMSWSRPRVEEMV